MRSLSIFGLAAMAAMADTVVMKNGDKLSGTILTTGDKGVSFKSEFAGEVTIVWENVKEVASATPVVITTKDGRKLAGTVKTVEEQVVSTPATGEPVSISRDIVAAVRSLEGQVKFEELENRALHPGFLDLYTGFYDFGFAGARGNSKTQAYSSAAKLNRITSTDNFGIYFNQVFASNSTISTSNPLGRSETTAQAVRGGGNYSRTLGKKWFLQGFNDYEYNRFQGLDLRVVVGGGLGYYLIKNNKGFLSLSGGSSWNREQFTTGLLRNSVEAYVAQEWVYKFNRVFSLNEKFVFFSNLSDGGQYRMNFDTTLAAALSRVFALQFTFSDRYLSNSLPTRKQNDVLFTAGIRATVPTREKGK